MAMSLKNSPSCALKLSVNPFLSSSSSSLLLNRRGGSSFGGLGLWNSSYRTRNGVKACFSNPIEEQPILKEALKEPIAFAGGVFAGLLRLDLNEDPLKEWVARTAEAAGVTKEEVNAQTLKTDEEEVEEIEIE